MANSEAWPVKNKTPEEIDELVVAQVVVVETVGEHPEVPGKLVVLEIPDKNIQAVVYSHPLLVPDVHPDTKEWLDRQS